VIRAVEADALTIVKSLIGRNWQKVERGIVEVQNRTVHSLYRPGGPFEKRHGRRSLGANLIKTV
jgi:hypothetical protein